MKNFHNIPKYTDVNKTCQLKNRQYIFASHKIHTYDSIRSDQHGIKWENVDLLELRALEDSEQFAHDHADTPRAAAFSSPDS